MARHALIALAAFGLTVSGCVSQEKYNALKLEKDQLVEQTARAQSAEREARAQADAWKQQLDALAAANNDASQLRGNLSEENAALREQLAALNVKYKNALDDQGQIIAGPVDPVLNSALQDFASQNPELVEWDAARGTLKFKSDVTFAVGSAELTPQARSVVSRLAPILNSAAAGKYEMLVAGHTDNVPVNNQATKAAGHKNNWYLSSHRAIAVGQELMANRVDSRRLGVVGYGDQRPIASNNTTDGRSKNRRVEILLLPNTVNGGAGMAEAAPVNAAPVQVQQRSARPVPAPVLNKDTAAVDNRPFLNK